MIPAQHSRAILWCLLLAFAVLIGAGYAVHLAGLRLNFTESFPQGLYWTVDKRPEKGDLVVVFPPASEVFLEAVERGYLHRSLLGFGPGAIMKEIAAVGGDRVSVKPTGVWVNGALLANSAPRLVDVRGRPLPLPLFNSYQLADDEVFLISQHHALSFDSRYFGVLKRKHIRDVVRPAFIYIPLKK